MFGNLSKSLIKVPNHFNINIETEPKNFSKKTYEKIINTNKILRKLNFYKSNRHSKVFKERDYIKKDLLLDLNYNNNFRKNITPHIKPRLSLSFEEFFFGNNNINTNINNKDSKLLNHNSKFNTYTGTKYSTSTKKEFLSSKNSMNSRDSNNNILKNMTKMENSEFSDNLNNNIDKLIKKIHGNSLNFNLFKSKRGFGGTTRQKRIEILKEFLKENQVVIPPAKIKFPKLNDKDVKSNERLYRDALDKKLTSLSMLSPKVKEQLKTKNRYFTAQKEFYRFNNSYFSNKVNPLAETIKCLEDKEKENIK